MLLKRGRLDSEELMLMRQHPVIGDNLCRTVKSLELVRRIVRSHHERTDGCGYPDGLSGKDIPLLAQIVGVVDVFDALTTNRPYRKAMTVQAAYELMLADAASGWCPMELVTTFIDLHCDSNTQVPAPPTDAIVGRAGRGSGKAAVSLTDTDPARVSGRRRRLRRVV